MIEHEVENRQEVARFAKGQNRREPGQDVVAPVELVEDVLVIVLTDLLDRLGEPAELALSQLGEFGEELRRRPLARQHLGGRISRPGFEQIRRRPHPSWLR
jgi:hypothetical protein